MKIYLSPSDQWANIVADGEHAEAYHCKQIAKAAEKYLLNYGYEVKVGNNDEKKTYDKRVSESNSWGADLHIPIHTNAGGGEGTTVFCSEKSKNNPYVLGVYEAVANLTPTKDRGVVVRGNLYEINHTNCPCIYLECDFHDDVAIEAWIDENVDALGKAIADGIAKVDGVPETSPVPSVSVYKVQAGAFEKLSNAKALAAKITVAGFENYIYQDDSDGLYKIQCGAFEKYANAKRTVEMLKEAGFDSFVREG